MSLRAGWTVVLVVAAVLVADAGTASASTCDTSWTGAGDGVSWFDTSNWDHGVPLSTSNACIEGTATHTVVIDGAAESGGTAAVAASLTLGGSAGTQTLKIEGDTTGTAPNGTEDRALLSLGSGGATITANGALTLTSTCSDSQSCTDGGSATLRSQGGTIDNQGTISVDAGSDGGLAGRALSGNLDNQGTIILGANLSYGVGGNTLTNDTNGLITNNNSGTGAVVVASNDTFDQGAGRTNPSSSFTGDPAVVMTGSSSQLNYTGTGASTIAAQGDIALQGNLASGQNLIIEGHSGTCLGPGGYVTSQQSFTNAGSITLAEPGSCGSELSVGSTNSSPLDATLTNTGTISTLPGGGPLGTAYLNGNVDNDGGLISVSIPTQYEGTDANSTLFTGATLDNRGTIHLHGANLTVGNSAGATVHNDNGGTITNAPGGNAGVPNGGPRPPAVILISGYLALAQGNTFNQGAGTTDPSGTDPGNVVFPAVVLESSALDFTGDGSAAISAQGNVALTGNIASGQDLIIAGISGVGCAPVTKTSALTNAGTIDMTGVGYACLKVSGGTITNTGTIITEPSTTGHPREINGSLTSSGQLQIGGPTDFNGSGTTLTQSAGSTEILAGQTLDLTGSSDTLALRGGLLSGSGAITGSVHNTGANVEPGVPSGPTPGQLSLTGAYSQGSAGKLTALISASGTPSSAYSQLVADGGSALAGTLAIVPISSFTPQTGQSFKVLDDGSAARSGTFGKITGQFPSGPSAGYDPIYNSSDVTLNYQAAKLLTVTRPGKGSGTVTSSPAGLDCGSTCQAPFFPGQTVTLTAHAAAGSVFVAWGGACSGVTDICHLTVSQSRAVTATFAHATTTSLSSSRNPAKVGRKVTFTATVSPRPGGGTVKFTSNGSTISGCGSVAVSTSTGKATCSVTYRSKGTRKIQATYSGNASYGRSTSSTLTETVT